MLETKDMEAKGLGVAKACLKAHTTKAAGITEKEKGKGKIEQSAKVLRLCHSEF